MNDKENVHIRCGGVKKTDHNKILLSQDYLKDAIKTKLSIV